MFNVVLKRNYKLPYNWSKMQLCRHNSDSLVVQYWSVASTASELLLAFWTTHFSCYQTLHMWQHSQSPFCIDLAEKQFKKENDCCQLCWRLFFLTISFSLTFLHLWDYVVSGSVFGGCLRNIILLISGCFQIFIGGHVANQNYKQVML